jgi:hypothetical protein
MYGCVLSTSIMMVAPSNKRLSYWHMHTAGDSANTR